jgi:predicted transcriptional regulator
MRVTAITKVKKSRSVTAHAKQELSRRERQAMDVVYAQGQVSATDVKARLPDNPSYSATRMLLQRLFKKGLLTFTMAGPKYIYAASTPRNTAGKVALAKLVQTFFNGSTALTFTALLGTSSQTLSDSELEELEKLVAQAKARRQ